MGEYNFSNKSEVLTPSPSLSLFFISIIITITTFSTTTFMMLGFSFKGLMCMVVGMWLGAVCGIDVKGMLSQMQDIEREAASSNQKVIVAWTLQLRLLVKAVSLGGGGGGRREVIEVARRLEQASMEYVNEDAIRGRVPRSVPDLFSCATLCFAYASIRHWERVAHYGGIVYGAVAERRGAVQIPSPFAGILLYLAILSMLPVSSSSLSHKSTTNEMMMTLKKLATGVCKRFPCLEGFQEIVEFKYGCYIRDIDKDEDNGDEDSKDNKDYSSSDTSAPPLLAWAWAWTRTEIDGNDTYAKELLSSLSALYSSNE